MAFSAICAHKLSHPSQAVSFIGYRPKPIGFVGADNKVVRRQHVIQCCSEHSIYDPAQGARVVSGPAPQPLASIDLIANGEGADAQGVMNRSLLDVKGEVLVVSQFTLHASIKKGNRPFYGQAAGPEQATALYEQFCRVMEQKTGNTVATGRFGANMQVSLVNDGPVTFFLESESQ